MASVDLAEKAKKAQQSSISKPRPSALARCISLRAVLGTAVAVAAMYLASRHLRPACPRGEYLAPGGLCEADPCAEVDCGYPRDCQRHAEGCKVACEIPYVLEGTLCVDACKKRCRRNQVRGCCGGTG
jgi:hypothetical protein